MNYERAYNELLNTVMNNADNIDVKTLQEIQNVNEKIDKGTPYEKSRSDKTRKDEIMNIKDNAERQQAIKQNMELFQ